jgi:hypothetical protein
MGVAPPNSTMCFLPSGASARVTRALRTPPASGVAGPSIRMFSNSCSVHTHACGRGLTGTQGCKSLPPRGERKGLQRNSLLERIFRKDGPSAKQFFREDFQRGWAFCAAVFVRPAHILVGMHVRAHVLYVVKQACV